ncbi:MAG: class I SAM-dependent DNA methyltransferase [Hydrogenophaga sp.]|uniref:class I SAM-dependent DNA methyltransferase n=1 Tax=Hydrogenophaga sp. TaxID=1904254 RepID=UPI004035A259
MPPQLLSKRDTSVAPIANRSASDFIKKWQTGSKASQLGERAGAQAHFLELCEVLGVETPTDADNYCFEKGVKGLSGTVRFADVWRRGCFAWEYKRPGKSLSDALEQLMRYALPLDNPPLLIVSDRQRIEIHTHFTGYPSRCVSIAHEELADRATLAKLRDSFLDPYSFRPEHDSKRVTEAAATAFASIADVLRQEGVEPQTAAHFLSQCVFCYFAEDIGLLSAFKRVVLKRSSGDVLKKSLTELFRKMQKGGTFGADDIAWFNGGLFNNIDVPVMPAWAVATLADVANMDWSAIDPSIFGTLFERGLDPDKRTQLGAYYTDPSIILRIVTPLVERTLMTEWDECKAQINGLLSERDVLRVQAKGIQSTSERLRTRRARIRTQANKLNRQANDVFSSFLERLRNFRVLDPACGSGNFLYLALKALKDVEKQANLDAETLGLEAQLPVTGPQNVLGLELNEYAAELARMTVWIGELQWRKQNGYGWKLNPVLDSLEHIECRDALLTRDGDGWIETTWPTADVIVGNPPFIGVSRKRRELGDDYVELLDRAYGDRVPMAADFVCYWFEKARAQLEAGYLQAAGLVATNSIRGGANRSVLERIIGTSRIFLAWSDEPWVNDGAAVRVSMVGFGQRDSTRLDDVEVALIHADLTAAEGIDLTKAQPLEENSNASFQGASKKAKFEIDEALALQWLKWPNPNGRPTSDIVKPWANGFEVARGPQRQWIIDFGTEMSEDDASLYEAPFAYVTQHVKAQRLANNRESYRRYWWRFAEARPALRTALKGLSRYISTVAHSKHRFFVWLPITTSPDQALITIAREDDLTLGLLHSRFHEIWSLRMGTSLEDRPRYTPTTCFETFPFPEGLTPKDTQVAVPDTTAAKTISAAALELVQLRNKWLNPPEWTDWVITPEEQAAGFPERPLAKRGHEADLKKRTLTQLYNARPAWLALAHETLDKAVAAAYGWGDYTPQWTDEDILRRLLTLNLQRSSS